jgi:hypothetical protein
MQNRFVVTGTKQDTKAVLLAYELVDSAFKINLYVIDKAGSNKANLKFIQENWINGEDFDFTGIGTLINPDINEDSILPADIKSEQTGEIRSKQNEWAVHLLTNKLWEVYLIKLEDLKKQATSLTNYSRDLFEDTKSFWEQVLENKKERNISQKRLEEIKADVNAIFEKLKTFRKNESEEFEKASKAAIDSIMIKLEEVKSKINEKANFKSLADEIKSVQQMAREHRYSKSHEANLRKAFDDTFHAINEARKSFFGSKNEHRVNGLKDVLSKMEMGLSRDQKDLEYFTAKAERPKIQSLELQLLKVRIRQIKDTIASKSEKMDDIKKTLEGLTKKNDSVQKVTGESSSDSVSSDIVEE